MDMMEIRHRVLLHLPKSASGPWLDYPTLTYDQQPLICSDGTQWTWNSGNYWEYSRTVEPKMVKAWFSNVNGRNQNLFSNNSTSYEAWVGSTFFNFRSQGTAYRNLASNDLFPITFDMTTGVISRSDDSVITTIPLNKFPFLLNCIAGRAGASNNNQYLYGIQVWL